MIQAERLFIKKEYKQAADHFRLALVHDSYSAHLHLRLAKTLGRMNAWFAVLEVLEKGVVAQPDNSELQFVLAKTYLDTEDYPSVEKLLTKMDPGASGYDGALLLRLEAALWRGDEELVHRIRAQSLKEYPDMAFEVGALLEDHGLQADARGLYEQCTNNDVESALSRIDFWQRGGKLSERIKTVSITVEMNLERARAVENKEMLRKAGVELRRAHRISPGDCHTLFRLGNWYGQSGDLIRALRYLEEAYRRCEKHPVIVITLAWAYLGQGEASKAYELGKRVLEFGLPEPFASEAKEIVERSERAKGKK